MNIVYMHDTALIFGRFQHWHNGHDRLVKIAMRMAKRVFIFVGSAQETGTRRNPFDIQTRIKVIQEIYGDNVIVKPVNDMTNENDINGDWGRYVLDICDRYIHKTPELMVYGNDDARSKWFDKQDMSFSEYVVNRYDDESLSATEIRHLLLIDDRKTWQKKVPEMIHGMYDELRSELLSVESYRKEFEELISA